jgi:hypothetical protein
VSLAIASAAFAALSWLTVLLLRRGYKLTDTDDGRTRSIEQYIRAGLACTHLEVSGDGAHFEAVIVSPSSRA